MIHEIAQKIDASMWPAGLKAVFSRIVFGRSRLNTLIAVKLASYVLIEPARADREILLANSLLCKSIDQIERKMRRFLHAPFSEMIEPLNWQDLVAQRVRYFEATWLPSLWMFLARLRLDRRSKDFLSSRPDGDLLLWQIVIYSGVYILARKIDALDLELIDSESRPLEKENAL